MRDTLERWFETVHKPRVLFFAIFNPSTSPGFTWFLEGPPLTPLPKKAKKVAFLKKKEEYLPAGRLHHKKTLVIIIICCIL